MGNGPSYEGNWGGVKLNDFPRTTHATYVATIILLEAISIRMIWFDLVQSWLYAVNHMKIHSPHSFSLNIQPLVDQEG